MALSTALRASIHENVVKAEGSAVRRGCCTTVRTNRLNDEFVYLRWPMRVLGGALVVFSVIEFGVGGYCYSFLILPNYVGAGAFWAGLMFLILGVLCLWMRTKAVALAALVMSFVAWIVGLAGVGLDGTVANIVNNSLACSQMITGAGFGPAYADYGYKPAQTGADVCYAQAYPALSNNFCYCSNTVIPSTVPIMQANAKCYNIQLNPNVANNCGEVFTSYGPALRASAGLCGFMMFISFFLVIILSISLCCEKRPQGTEELAPGDSSATPAASATPAHSGSINPAAAEP